LERVRLELARALTRGAAESAVLRAVRFVNVFWLLADLCRLHGPACADAAPAKNRGAGLASIPVSRRAKAIASHSHASLRRARVRGYSSTCLVNVEPFFELFCYLSSFPSSRLSLQSMRCVAASGKCYLGTQFRDASDK
jgi:hypothetical protein